MQTTTAASYQGGHHHHHHQSHHHGGHHHHSAAGATSTTTAPSTTTAQAHNSASTRRYPAHQPYVRHDAFAANSGSSQNGGNHHRQHATQRTNMHDTGAEVMYHPTPQHMMDVELKCADELQNYNPHIKPESVFLCEKINHQLDSAIFAGVMRNIAIRICSSNDRMNSSDSTHRQSYEGTFEQEILHENPDDSSMSGRRNYAVRPEPPRKPTDWLLRVTQRCCFSMTSVVCGLFYLDKLTKERKILFTDRSWDLIWVSLMIISEKFWEDNYIHPGHILYTAVSDKAFQDKEKCKDAYQDMLKMQFWLLEAMDWKLNIPPSSFDDWVHYLRDLGNTPPSRLTMEQAPLPVLPNPVFHLRPIPNLKQRRTSAQSQSTTSTATPEDCANSDSHSNYSTSRGSGGGFHHVSYSATSSEPRSERSYHQHQERSSGNSQLHHSAHLHHSSHSHHTTSNSHTIAQQPQQQVIPQTHQLLTPQQQQHNWCGHSNGSAQGYAHSSTTTSGAAAAPNPQAHHVPSLSFSGYPSRNQVSNVGSTVLPTSLDGQKQRWSVGMPQQAPAHSHFSLAQQTHISRSGTGTTTATCGPCRSTPSSESSQDDEVKASSEKRTPTHMGFYSQTHSQQTGYPALWTPNPLQHQPPHSNHKNYRSITTKDAMSASKSSPRSAPLGLNRDPARDLVRSANRGEETQRYNLSRKDYPIPPRLQPGKLDRNPHICTAVNSLH